MDKFDDLLNVAKAGASAAPSPRPGSAQSAAPGGNVAAFVAEVGPTAAAVGERIGVDPAVLIGQWGLETGWGKSVIPGTNNLGNIKAFDGSGVAATDNMTGSRDRYRQYASYDGFGADYAGLIERRYRGAMGAGADASRFGEALKAGGYAEDPDYAAKLARAADMVRGAGGGGTVGARQAAQPKPRDNLGIPANPYSFADFDRREADAAAARELEEGRTWGEVAGDVGLAVTGGAFGIAELVGTGVGLVTGDMDNVVRIGGETVREWAQQNQSKVLQAHKKLRAMTIEGEETEAGKFFAYLSETLGSPALAVDFIAEQVPQLAVMGGVGRAAGAGAQALGLGARGANAVGTGAAIGAGSTMQGLDAASQAYSAIMAMPRGQQLQNRAVQQLIAEGVEEREAVERVARAEALTAGAMSAGISAAVNALPGAATLERTLAGGAARGTSRVAGALKGAAGEGASEAIDEMGGVGAANLAAQQFNPEQSLTEGMGEAAAAGALFAPFGGVAGAMEAPPFQPKPNSPLANAAGAAAAAGGVTAPQPAVEASATSPATADGATAESSVAPDGAQPENEADPRLAAVQSFVEDKTFLQALRTAPGFGKESVSELLAAYAKARNPNVDPLIRERALADIEGFIETFNGRPNFTMGGQQAEEVGTAVVPAAGQAPTSPDAPRLEAPAFAERDITPQPETPAQPAGALVTPEVMQAKRDADAAYDQAFQDLVKAEQLGAADADILAYQQALDEAKAQRAAMDARLEEIHEAIVGNRAARSKAERLAVLDQVLADPETVNPAERFAAELNRQGFLDSSPTADELATIERFRSIQAATAAPDVEPSTPNEMPADLVRERAAPAASTPRDRIAEVRRLVAEGWRPGAGRELVSPTGKRRNLNAPEFAAAREAYRKEQEGARAQEDDRQDPAARAAAAVSDQQEPQARAGDAPAGEAAIRAQAQEEVTQDAAEPEQVAEEAPKAREPEGAAQGEGTGIGSAVGASAEDGVVAPADAGIAAVREAVAAAEAATDAAPTDAMKAAGNYSKGKVDLHGQRISIETPKGAERSGVGEDGERWAVTMPASYGYFLGTLANDGDHVDVFLGPKPEAGMFWVVNQVKPDTAIYDEPKVMLGYESGEAAQADYLQSFSGTFGARVLGSIVGPFSVAELGKMLPKMKRNKPVDGTEFFVGPAVAAEREAAVAASVEEAPALGIQAFLHTKTKKPQYVVALPIRLEREAYQEMNRRALGWRGRWSGYDKDGAIAGFLFQDEAMAQGFIADKRVQELVSVATAEPTGAADAPPSPQVKADPDLTARLAQARRDLDVVRGRLKEQGRVTDARLEDRARQYERLVAELVEEARANNVPIYPAGHEFVGDGGLRWSLTAPVMVGDKTAEVEVMNADGTPASAPRMFSVGYVEQEMRLGREWQAEQERDAQKRAAAPETPRTVEPVTLDEMRAALQSGARAHFDYAGVDGRTLWVEPAGNGMGWVVKSQDDGSGATFTKGGDPRGGGFSQDEAVARALQDAEYRFTQWKPIAEQPVAAPENGEVRLAAADDLGAMFDEILSEEIAARPKREKTAEAPKAEPSGAVKKAAARVRIIPGSPESPAFIVKDPEGNGNNGITLASFEIGASGRPVKVKHYYSHTRDYAQLAIDQWMTANKPAPVASQPKAPRTAGKAAASAAQNTAAGLVDAIAGLGKLFGGNGRLSSGLTFDEETYAKAKPLFAQAVAHLRDAGSDIKDVMRAVVRMVLDQFGQHAAANMKPYAVRFIDDYRTGRVGYDANDNGESNDDGRDESGSNGNRALGALAAAEDSRSEGSGDARNEGEPSGRAGDERDQPAGEQGRGAARGRGNGVARVHPAAARARGEVTRAAPAAIPAQNFVITDDVRLGKGGEVQKFNDNVAAIRIVKTLEAEKRRATPDEQRQLARYVGWGGLAPAFRNAETGAFGKGWEKRGEELESLLTRAELDAARRSTMDAHYTAQPVVQAMWSAVERLGFRGGMVLEPSVGVGNFLGLVPAGLRGDTRFMGVEYDPVTASIARALYPQSSVLSAGFQTVPLPEGVFDLAIGNPPFGGQSLYFPHNDRARGLSIHNQFFVASLDAVKPGGLLAMVVSRYLMDAKDAGARRLLAQHADLLGAIRLPDTAFQENARTEVVTDIIFLKKRAVPLPSAAAISALDAETAWVGTTEVADPLGGEPITLNQYFASNPQMMLGTLERSGSMRFGGDVTLRAKEGNDIAAALGEAIARLPEGVAERAPDAVSASVEQFEALREGLELALEGREEGAIYRDENGQLQHVTAREAGQGRDQLTRRLLSPTAPWSPQLAMGADGRWFRVVPKVDEQGNKLKNGRFVVYDREVFAREEDVPETLRLGRGSFERLSALVDLRDLLKRQLVLETNDDPGIEANRAALSQAYGDFVKRYGFVGEGPNQALLAGMPDGPLVSAIELRFDAGVTPAKARRTGEKTRKPSATPAPILTKRVVLPYSAPESATSADDALQIALSETGAVDLDRIASLLKVDVAEVAAQLHEDRDSPLIFRDPETERWVTRDEYLSGPVVRKLAAARAAGLDKNVAALEAVQPPPIDAADIGVRLGSAWVPPEIYSAFVEHITGRPGRVTFVRAMNLFDVRGDASTPASHTEWGTHRADAVSLIADMLNSRAIAVYDYYKDEHGNQKRTLNEEETASANQKATEILNEFADWIMAEPERRERLATIYNEQFNNRVIRQYDGSHLKLPGKVPDAVIKMRRHQMNAIWRGIAERFTLYDHTVGAGKTFTAIARAMERRRMGLSRKPMIVVPNHMVEQFATDVYRLYPGAKVLAAGKADFEKAKRRRIFSRIATGDWDVVIVPHSSFGFIGISPEREAAYIEADIRDLEEAVERAEAEDHDGGRFKPQSVKEGERQLERLRERLKKVSDMKRDNLLTFEQLGVDDLTVDEAHEFKNLRYFTRLTKVLGLGSKEGSKKANDLYNKVRVLRESPRGSVTFMTGTPISNSIVEMYTMMRYLAADELAEGGIEHFDAWHKQFAEAVTKFELNDANQLAEKTRLARWSNMPELMKLYYSFTDAVSLDDIKRWYREDNGADFPVPRVKGGKRQNVIVQPTPAQEAILDDVVREFNGLRDIKDPRERNAKRLRLMDRARKVSLDARAVDPSLRTDEKGGKLEAVAEQVARIYREWAADKGTQLVFLDRSVPKAKGDDKVIAAYDKLRAEEAQALRDGDEARFLELQDDLAKFDPAEIAALRAAQSGGWTAYDQIKRNLIAQGIPENEVRFIQEANTDEQKQQIFDSVKAGDTRVLLGSTPRMGAGTNVQDRLVGLHHVDVNWKPSDIEQREGRAVRQGNLLQEKYGDEFEVELVAYATERTYDAKMWALNEAKGRFINGLRAYTGDREVEIDDSESENMAEMAAMASGDPRMLERVQLDAEVKRLELLRRAFNRRRFSMEDAIRRAERDLETLPPKLEGARADDRAILDAIDAAEAEHAARQVIVGGEVFSRLFDAHRAAQQMIDEMKGDNPKARFKLDVDGKELTSVEAVGKAIDAALGDPAPFPLVMADGTRPKHRKDAAGSIAEQAEQMARYNTEEAAVGTLYGLPLRLFVGQARLGEGKALTLSVDGRYVQEALDAGGIGDDGAADRKAVQNAVARLGSYVSAGGNERRLLERIKRAEVELPPLREQHAKPFPQQAEYEQKGDRLSELTKELAAESTPSAAPSVLRNTDANPGAVDGVVSRVEADAFLAGFLSRFPGAPEMVVLNTFDQLPPEVQANAKQQNSDERSTKGVFHRGKVYLVVGNHSSMADFEATVFHEVLGHAGVRAMLGPDFVQKLNQVFIGLGGQGGLVRIMNRRGLGDTMQRYIRGILQAQQYDADAFRQAAAGGDPTARRIWTDAMAKAVLTEEVFAHIAEQIQDRPALWDRFMELIGRVRQWLRDHGFAELAALSESDLLFMLSNARETMHGPDGPGGARVTRAGVTVTESEVFTPDGKRLNQKDPDFAAAMRLADLLGLREEPGVTVFSAARRVWLGVRSVNDSLVPETPDYEGNTTGNLAYLPGNDRVEALPIRLPVGVVKGDHAGFGLAHIADNATKDRRRAPAPETGDLAEDIAREVVRVLQHVRSAHADGRRWALYAPSLNKAVIVEARERSGERHYSVVTVVPGEARKWGGSEWSGRLAFPDREAAETSPPTAQSRQTDESPRSDRKGPGDQTERSEQETRTEHFNLTRPEGGRQASVTVKKRRKIVRDDGSDGTPPVFRGGAGGIDDFAQSRSGRRAIRERIAGAFDAVVGGNSVRTFNWWNRTIGSQYHKAKKSPEFRRVYDLAHAFVDDVSRFANEAADRAKNILPHLDTWSDMVAGMNVRRAWADAKDYQAIAEAVFQGTLANGTTGQVWTDAQLRDDFGLTDKQVGLYREFRAAVDHSLETLAASEMARAARAAKLEVADVEMGMDEALDFYTDQADSLIDAAKANRQDAAMRHKQERAAFNDEFGDMPRPGAYAEAERIMLGRQRAEVAEADAAVAQAEALRASFTDKADQIRRLQAEGYAPLMRFGQYTVDVVRLDADGNPEVGEDGQPDRPFFGMFESEAEARDAARILQEEYPDYTITRGVVSAEANQLYKGITPETAEMFARLLGTDQEGAFQAYLKQAVANRSAMKRLIQRKGMAGFAQDVPRVLAAFITSTARLAAGNWHFGEMTKAAADIPQVQGDVKDEAVKLIDYVQNPREEAAGLRGFLFFSFLGGSVAAALVNTTQTFSTTLPYLHQFGPKEAANAITKAMGAAARAMRKGLDVIDDKALRTALTKAAEEGIIDPQEIHLLMAESGGNGASNIAGTLAGMANKEWATPASRVARSFTQAWGGFFGMAEKYNRHVAFMAAWEVAGEMTEAEIKAAGAADRYDFAKRAVIETQFDYTKVARPNWARGAVGATLFTFKTFLVNYLEFIARLPSRERAVAIAVLLLLSGLSGAPGADDLDDIIDAIGQKFGYNWNSAAARHGWLMKTLGEGGANFVEHGVSSFMPIDVSARLGMGNIIPGTEALKKSSSDKGRDAAEVLGPIGSVLKGSFTVLDDVGTGKDFGELIRPVAPKAYGDLYQALDILQTGYYRDSRGRKVVEADALDAAMKAIGFQPNAVAEPRRVEWMIGQSAQMQRAVRSDIYELWSRGVFEQDAEKVAIAKEMLRNWNRKNPDTPIRANPQSIAQRVKAMRSSSAERMVKATPREMRGMIRNELAVTE